MLKLPSDWMTQTFNFFGGVEKNNETGEDIYTLNINNVKCRIQEITNKNQISERVNYDQTYSLFTNEILRKYENGYCVWLETNEKYRISLVKIEYDGISQTPSFTELVLKKWV